MRNPYILDTPAVLSFSGGRTSGYMLHQTVLAYGGKLPDDLKVVFCNTGRERPETLCQEFLRRLWPVFVEELRRELSCATT